MGINGDCMSTKDNRCSFLFVLHCPIRTKHDDEDAADDRVRDCDKQRTKLAEDAKQ